MLQTIGQRVRAAREKCGLSQAELARRLKASVNAINMLEQDAIHDPRASRIIGIARELGVSADYLLGLQDDTQAAPSTAKPREASREEKPTGKRQRPRKAASVA